MILVLGIEEQQAASGCPSRVSRLCHTRPPFMEGSLPLSQFMFLIRRILCGESSPKQKTKDIVT